MFVSHVCFVLSRINLRSFRHHAKFWHKILVSSDTTVLAKHVATVYLQQSVVIDTNSDCRPCCRIFDLSFGDYIIEIPLAWEITEMGKKIRKNGIAL